MESCAKDANTSFPKKTITIITKVKGRCPVLILAKELKSININTIPLAPNKPKPKRNRSWDQKSVKNKKEKAVTYKGGKCEKCGYNKCIAALDFHHKNPEEKIYDVKSLMNRKWELIQEEIDKCILLCSNCHREEHWNERRKKLADTL